MTKDPPGDGDEPHDDQGHREDIVEKVAAELTDVTASPALADAACELIKSDPHQEKDPDADSSRHEEPGHIGLGRTVWVGFSIRVGLQVILESTLYSLSRDTSSPPITVMQQRIGKPRM